jgi:hypothetical protein
MVYLEPDLIAVPPVNSDGQPPIHSAISGDLHIVMEAGSSLGVSLGSLRTAPITS